MADEVDNSKVETSDDTPALVKQAEETAQKLKQERELLAAERQKIESLMARQALSGRAEAGQTPKVVTEEEKIKAEANVFMKRMGMKEL